MGNHLVRASVVNHLRPVGPRDKKNESTKGLSNHKSVQYFKT